MANSERESEERQNEVSTGLPKLDLEQSRLALAHLIGLDPSDVSSAEKFRQYYLFPNAAVGVIGDILVRDANVTTTSSYHYLVTQERDLDWHLLSVTFPVEEALELSFNASREERVRFIRSTTPAEFNVSSEHQGRSTMLFSLRLKPTYDGDNSNNDLSVVSYDGDGKYKERADIWDGHPSLKERDFQVGAEGVQRCAGVLLNWSRSLDGEQQALS